METLINSVFTSSFHYDYVVGSENTENNGLVDKPRRLKQRFRDLEIKITTRKDKSGGGPLKSRISCSLSAGRRARSDVTASWLRSVPNNGVAWRGQCSGHGSACDPTASRPSCRHCHALQIPQVTTALPVSYSNVSLPELSADARLIGRELTPPPPPQTILRLRHSWEEDRCWILLAALYHDI